MRALQQYLCFTIPELAKDQEDTDGLKQVNVKKLITAFLDLIKVQLIQSDASGKQ